MIAFLMGAKDARDLPILWHSYRDILHEHNPPHFHALYGGDKASIGIRDLSIIEGSIPPRALGLVMEWAAMHQPELMSCWEHAMSSQQPGKIQPLS
jgi:hypothetical protein